MGFVGDNIIYTFGDPSESFCGEMISHVVVILALFSLTVILCLLVARSTPLVLHPPSFSIEALGIVTAVISDGSNSICRGGA